MASIAQVEDARAREGDSGEDASAVELWSYWRSSSSYRVRIALNLKGVRFATHAVHLARGEQFSPSYAALNASKEVPTLRVDGLLLTQSQAIIEYLEETRPAPALLPADAARRALVRQLCCIISNDIQPVCNLRILKAVQAFPAADAAERDARRLEWAQTYIALGFAAFEALLASSGAAGGAYCVGDAITMADVFLAPQVYNAERFKLSLAPFPHIARIAAALAAVPAFAAAHPSAQPDAERDA